ncbi:MFS transporter [Nonomuraea sp. NPDC059007]|uniref:MFS transporter n=1 Tax=Nonomuraea sp. NPDC059007 TaxID=3346692 RepID=UPI0036B48B84
MYLSSTYVSSTGPRRRLRVGGLPATVFALGLVSFFTDVSAEMVAAFLPMYLMYGLGTGLLQLGLLDGLYTGASALLRVAGGHLADRWSRPKAVALCGYGLSALSKLAFPLAGGALGGIGAAIAVDRAGKGLRAAPRDALIAAATPPRLLGAAFGVHRALDTAGALLGPIAVFALVGAVGDAYDAVFVVSFCLALVGIVILAAFVRNHPVRPAAPAETHPPGRQAARAGAGLREGLRLLAERPLRRVTLFASLLGLATAGDAILFVAVQRQAGLPASALPLLPLVTSLVFLAAAVPLGRLADKVGGWRIFLMGHVLLALSYLFVAHPDTVAAALLLHGLFYASTDGVLMAHLAGMLPAHLRATGLAVTQTGQALARMAGAIGFGFLATGLDLRWCFLIGATLLLSTLLAAWRSGT